jgi:aminoglycoside phosphotransferase (APT) family kinase protein
MSAALIVLGDRLAAYLRERWPHAQELAISDLQQIHGGASRETYRLKLRYRADGREVRRGVILRRDPPTSLIDTERALEYRTYAAVYPTEVPVPEPLVLEEDPRYLDHAFSLMAEIPGCETAIALFGTPHYAGLREKIGRAKWSILGKLAALDVATLGAGDFMEVPSVASCAMREVDYWEAVIDKDAMLPQPIAKAAIRWLRRNVPPPAKKLALVHGDYRSGNFLFDPNGDIRGVLDWEMAHLGDPLEDVAWACLRCWRWAGDGRIGGLLPRAEFYRRYEEAGGASGEEEAVRFWEVLGNCKMAIISLTGARSYASGLSCDSIHAFTAYLVPEIELEVLRLIE